ncbi:MAG: cyclic nucleotide-binding domain-containing protein [Microscillaceae bacterium]|nr:cyclic nucleotide-binding domain-containing protein [Microscillaceae bacterium]
MTTTSISDKLQAFVLYIQKFISVEEGEMINFLEKFEFVSYKQEQSIYTGGKVCQYMFFLSKGIVREEEIWNNKRKITWLTFENEIFTDNYAYISQKVCPQPKNFIACTDVALFRIRIDELRQFYKSKPKWERLGRLIAEQYILLIAQQAEFLLKNDAKHAIKSLWSNALLSFKNCPLPKLPLF